MQLFVTPLLIVCAIVGLWFLASWLVNAEARPEKLVDDIERLNHGSWQKALTLANQLRNPRNRELRTNPAIAQRLAEVLQNQLQTAGDTDAQHWLTLYLCRALGEFEVDTGLDTLIMAAQPRQVQPRKDPRRAAIEGIALLATHLEAGIIAKREEAVNVIIQATEAPSVNAADKEDRREQRRLRATAAYALGVIGGNKATGRLKSLVMDPDADVRQNAIIGLARNGDVSVLPELTKLLPPTDEQLAAGLDEEIQSDPVSRTEEIEFKRNLTTSAAIQGLIRLMKDHRELDSTSAERALKQLEENTLLNATLRQEAGEAIRYLQRLRQTNGATSYRNRLPSEWHSGGCRFGTARVRSIPLLHSI